MQIQWTISIEIVCFKGLQISMTALDCYQSDEMHFLQLKLTLGIFGPRPKKICLPFSNLVMFKPENIEILHMAN